MSKIIILYSKSTQSERLQFLGQLIKLAYVAVQYNCSIEQAQKLQKTNKKDIEKLYNNLTFTSECNPSKIFINDAILSFGEDCFHELTKKPKKDFFKYINKTYKELSCKVYFYNSINELDYQLGERINTPAYGHYLNYILIALMQGFSYIKNDTDFFKDVENTVQFATSIEDIKFIIEQTKITGYLSFDAESCPKVRDLDTKQLKQHATTPHKSDITIVCYSYQPGCSWIIPYEHFGSWFNIGKDDVIEFKKIEREPNDYTDHSTLQNSYKSSVRYYMYKNGRQVTAYDKKYLHEVTQFEVNVMRNIQDYCIKHDISNYLQELVIPELNSIFQDKSIKKIAHNISFDYPLFNLNGVKIEGQLNDTMHMYHLIDVVNGKGLKLLSTFMHPQYEGYGDSIDYFNSDLYNLGVYGGFDADLTIRLYFWLLKQIMDDAILYRAYNSYLQPLTEFLCKLTYEGMKVDRKRANEVIQEVENMITKYKKHLSDHDLFNSYREFLANKTYHEMLIKEKAKLSINTYKEINKLVTKYILPNTKEEDKDIIKECWQNNKPLKIEISENIKDKKVKTQQVQKYIDIYNALLKKDYTDEHVYKRFTTQYDKITKMKLTKDSYINNFEVNFNSPDQVKPFFFTFGRELSVSKDLRDLTKEELDFFSQFNKKIERPTICLKDSKTFPLNSFNEIPTLPFDNIKVTQDKVEYIEPEIKFEISNEEKVVLEKIKKDTKLSDDENNIYIEYKKREKIFLDKKQEEKNKHYKIRSKLLASYSDTLPIKLEHGFNDRIYILPVDLYYTGTLYDSLTLQIKLKKITPDYNFNLAIYQTTDKQGLKLIGDTHIKAKDKFTYKDLIDSDQTLNISIVNKQEIVKVIFVFHTIENFSINGLDLELKYTTQDFGLDNEIPLVTKTLTHPVSKKKFKKTQRAFTTSKTHLTKLENGKDFIELYLIYKAFCKIYSTYMVGMLDKLNALQSSLHSTFRPISTWRIASRDPNLQNIPSRSKYEDVQKIVKMVKSCFIPFDPDHFMAQTDLSQAELRIFASLGGIDTMKQVYLQNGDIHSLTASNVLDVPLKEFMSWKKSDNKPTNPKIISFETERKAFKMYRFNAKAYNFGLIYGISPESLREYAWSAYGIQITLQEAIEVHKKFFSKIHPQIPAYHEAQHEHCKKTGYAETLFGTRRHLPNINNVENPELFSQDKRNAINTPTQGTGGMWMLFSMMIAEYRLLAAGFIKNKDYRYLNTIHDSGIFTVSKKNPKDPIRIFQESCDYPPIEEYFNTNLEVPMRSDVEVGLSWGELEELDKDWYQTDQIYQYI